MGTRGYFGFYYKGTYYICYNHWDSYPRGLGSTLVEEIVQALEGGQFSSWLTILESRIKKVDTDSEEISNDTSDEETKEKKETADDTDSEEISNDKPDEETKEKEETADGTDREETPNDKPDEETIETKETADGPSFMNFLKLKNSIHDYATKNPQWEQFAYIINFDETKFEFYVKWHIAMEHKLELETLKHLLATFQSCIN